MTATISQSVNIKTLVKRIDRLDFIFTDNHFLGAIVFELRVAMAMKTSLISKGKDYTYQQGIIDSMTYILRNNLTAVQEGYRNFETLY